MGGREGDNPPVDVCPYEGIEVGDVCELDGITLQCSYCDHAFPATIIAEYQGHRYHDGVPVDYFVMYGGYVLKCPSCGEFLFNIIDPCEGVFTDTQGLFGGSDD